MRRWPGNSNGARTTFGGLSRSALMSRIRSKGNATTELKLAHVLRAAGVYGWRRNFAMLGKPDFVFPKHRVAVFVDGCFWHGHRTKCRMPKANRDYWKRKIARNAARDRFVTRALTEKGWKVVRIWEHMVQKPSTIIRLRKALT